MVANQSLEVFKTSKLIINLHYMNQGLKKQSIRSLSFLQMHFCSSYSSTSEQCSKILISNYRSLSTSANV